MKYFLLFGTLSVAQPEIALLYLPAELPLTCSGHAAEATHCAGI